MVASFNFFMMLSCLFGIGTLASPLLDRNMSPAVHSAQDMSERSASTCADPSLVTTIFQAYTEPFTAHLMNVHYAFVHSDSATTSGWMFQGAVFKGWLTQQPFTVPLFRLEAPNTSDFVFMVGADAQTPPVVSGFTAGPILAWVYNTSACDSVPLMSAVLASKTDHYYTTNPNEHAGLLSLGWTDGGVTAFVLPPV